MEFRGFQRMRPPVRNRNTRWNAQPRMHPDDHHLIERHKALVPTFEHEKDAESNIDVGVDVEEV